MIPCARIRIRQRIRIRKRLFWLDHVAIYAVSYGCAYSSFASLFVLFPAIAVCSDKNILSVLPSSSSSCKQVWQASCSSCFVHKACTNHQCVLQRDCPFFCFWVIYTKQKQTSNNGFEWTDAMPDGVKKGENAQPSVYVNTTKNIHRYEPIVCTQKAFAGRLRACHILIRVRTNELTP